MTIIVADASAIVALLLDNGAAGRWSAQALSGADLAAPHLRPFEVANVIRRHATARLIGHDVAEQSQQREDGDQANDRLTRELGSFA